MKNTFVKTFVLLVLFATPLISGCGGGGGGGGGTPAAQIQSTTTVSDSTMTKNFIARQIASTYSTLDNYAGTANIKNRKSATSIKLSTVTEPGIGQVRVTYDTNETVSQWGVNYTYSSGYQDLIARDNAGQFSDNENLIDSIEINSVNMACSINDGQEIMNLVYNGKLSLQGLLGSTITVSAQNLNMAGNINNIDQINWTINGRVSVNKSSYPYPTNGSSESGTLIFNGHTYNYTTSYNGSNLASVSFSGAENFIMTINLATGAVVSSSDNTSQSKTSSLTGSWKIVEENREDVMLPVKANADGKVSLVHFYADNTFKMENIESSSNSSINYWQTENAQPQITTGTWQLIGNNLQLKSGNQTAAQIIEFSGNRFTQTNQWLEKFIWQKI